MQKRTTNNKSDRVFLTPFFIYVKKIFDFFLLKNLKFTPTLVIFNIEKDNFTSVIGRGYWGRVKI